MEKNITNLFVLGSARCGTTLISYTLNQNPEYNVSFPSETMYFLKNFKEISLNEYEQFNYKKKKGIKVDCSPQHSLDINKTIDNIKKIYNIDNCRFIYIIRNPIERSISHAYKAYNRGEPFAQDHNNNSKNFEALFEVNKNNVIAEYSLYHKRVVDIINKIDNDKILFLHYDQLTEDFDNYFNLIDDFCRVKKFKYRKRVVNSGSAKSKFSFIDSIITKKNTLKSIIKLLFPSVFLRKVKDYYVLNFFVEQNRSQNKYKSEIKMLSNNFKKIMYKDYFLTKKALKGFNIEKYFYEK